MAQLLRPADEAELADILTEAAGAGTPLEILGTGSKSAIGRPLQTAAQVTTRMLRGITLYEPSEMVLAARAGTPLAQIERELEAKGQELAFEPIDLAPIVGGESGQTTIGAVAAANISGPRRILAGAARDHLLGVRAVNGRGERFSAGGRVMKNVTGYDVARMLAGSWGTLAVLTEVTFKVLPRAEAVRTLLFTGMPDEIAVEVMCAAMSTPYAVSGTVHLQPTHVARLDPELVEGRRGPITALRLESFASSLDYRAGKLTERFAAHGKAEALDDAASRAFWGAMRRLAFLEGGSDPLWRISTAPKMGPRVVNAISGYMDVHAAYDWSGGLIWLEVPPSADAGAADIRRVLATLGGHATLIRAEPAVRASVEVFQPLDPVEARLSRRIKAAFDPSGILNPGRMYAES